MTKLEAVVFDFFGVICSEIAPAWLERHLTAAAAVDVKSRIVGDADRGVISTARMFEQLASVTSVPADRIEAEWRAAARIDEDMVDLVLRLARRTRLGLLTNAPADFFKPIFGRTRLRDTFESVVISSEQGMAKPDHRIFATMASSLGVDAGAVLLIDDNPANIAAAASAGWHTVLFSEQTSLEAALADFDF